jgi:Undecaprenyl-phosphate glucose phosphotransferase
MNLRCNSYRFYFRACFWSLPIAACLSAAYARLYLGRLWLGPAEYSRQFYMAVALLCTVVWVVLAENKGLCDVNVLFEEYTGARAVFSCSVTTALALACALFFYREQNLSRFFFAATSIALFVYAIVCRSIFRAALRNARKRRSIRVLIVGADEHAVRIAGRLQETPFAAIEVVAHLRLPSQNVAVKNLPIYELEEADKDIPVLFQDVIVALPPSETHLLSEVVQKVEGLCAPIRAVLDFGEIPVVRERLFRSGNLQLLDVATSPVESPYYFLLKRMFDIAFSSVALIVGAPWLALIAVLIKLESPGPVLFRQERIGLNGRSFTMYKLRTMRYIASTEQDTSWTTQNDNRRTIVGAFLRRFSIDEIPQFFNVLRGEMSVVGPRPERPYFVNKFLGEISHYNVRHRLKVGITGWAQVNGFRGDTCIRKRCEFDLYYLQNWSLWFDFRIVWLTVYAGLFGRNAY